MNLRRTRPVVISALITALSVALPTPSVGAAPTPLSPPLIPVTV